MTTAQPASQPRSIWVTVAIIAVMLLVVCVLASICTLVVLALLGPINGAVFSKYLTSMPPTP